MKFLIFTVLLVFLQLNLQAQTERNLFSQVASTEFTLTELGLIGDHTFLELNTTTWNDLLETHPSSLVLKIPFNGDFLTLNLHKAQLFKKDLTIGTASGNDLLMSEASKSVYYQGDFEGHHGSHFALSILNNEVIGIGSILGIGDVNLGKIEGSEFYVFYPESSLNGRNNFRCDTDDAAIERIDAGGDDRAIYDDCSGIYFEVDYDIFLAKGGVIEAADYMTALFNEIQLLYQIEDMTVFLSDIKVWDEVSPYYLIGDTGILLGLFGTTTVVWDGDLGHLVTNSAGGGLAYVNVFCNPDQAIRKAVSGIELGFSPIPVYSWSVEVVSHEMGHNMGSPHTHACFWNGDMTAIDGCGPDAGFDEGCAGTLPVDGGTVMSYCHLTGVGINLGFGFGPQPAAYMISNIEAAPCLEGCDLTEMDVQITSGDISATCENGPIYRELSIVNNGNENLTSFDVLVYLDGVLTETIEWTGLVLVDGSTTISLPVTSLPMGSYTMLLVIESPNGYEDEVTSDNDFSFSFDVTAYPEASFTPNPSELVSYNAIATMNNTSSGASSYTWDFDDGSPIIAGVNPTHAFPFEYGGTYTVKLFAASEFGCVDTTEEIVNVKGVNIYYIPNSFSPEKESFKPVFSAGLDVYDYHFTVYNRYGEILFESFNESYGWNGMYGDNGFVPAGVYVWKLDFGDLTTDERHTEVGHVNVMR